MKPMQEAWLETLRNMPPRSGQTEEQLEGARLFFMMGFSCAVMKLTGLTLGVEALAYMEALELELQELVMEGDPDCNRSTDGKGGLMASNDPTVLTLAKLQHTMDRFEWEYGFSVSCNPADAQHPMILELTFATYKLKTSELCPIGRAFIMAPGLMGVMDLVKGEIYTSSRQRGL